MCTISEINTPPESPNFLPPLHLPINRNEMLKHRKCSRSLKADTVVFEGVIAFTKVKGKEEICGFRTRNYFAYSTYIYNIDDRLIPHKRSITKFDLYGIIPLNLINYIL